jgi:hypothetical protein
VQSIMYQGRLNGRDSIHSIFILLALVRVQSCDKLINISDADMFYIMNDRIG